MTNKLKFGAVGLTLSLAVWSAPYVVQEGETLSQIIQRKFPNERIFGKSGKLREVLSSNKFIKNPNKIYPNQVILFNDEEIVKEKEEKFVPDVACEGPVLKPTPTAIRDEWNLSALYGAKYTSVNQTGAIGRAELGVLFLNNFKLKSDFRYNDWGINAEFETYEFKYKSLTNSDSDRMNSMDLGFSYKWFTSGVGLKQVPIFRNNSGDIQMATQTIGFLKFGAKKEISLQTIKPTFVKFEGGLSLPFSGSTDNAAAKVSSVTGYGLQADVELSRTITKKKDYELRAIWENGFNHINLSQHTEWGTQSGNVKLKHISFSSVIGIQVSF